MVLDLEYRRLDLGVVADGTTALAQPFQLSTGDGRALVGAIAGTTWPLGFSEQVVCALDSLDYRFVMPLLHVELERLAVPRFHLSHNLVIDLYLYNNIYIKNH